MLARKRVFLPATQKLVIEEIIEFEPGYKFKASDIRCVSEKKAVIALYALKDMTRIFVLIDGIGLIYERVDKEDPWEERIWHL